MIKCVDNRFARLVRLAVCLITQQIREIMKKIKNEAALSKKAIQVGENYALKRGYAGFSSTMSANEKTEAIYRLLVLDKLVVGLPADKEDLPSMKHKLALWIQKLLPKDDPLLK
jgi:hypothetical protein